MMERINKFRKLKELAAEHCKKYGKVAGKSSWHGELGESVSVATIMCD